MEVDSKLRDYQRQSELVQKKHVAELLGDFREHCWHLGECNLEGAEHISDAWPDDC